MTLTFHFSVGNSTDGPIGMCARIAADNAEAAVKRLQELLPESWDTDTVWDLTPDGMTRKDEYIAVYFNPSAIKADDIDSEDED